MMIKAEQKDKCVFHKKGGPVVFGERDLVIDLDNHINSDIDLGKTFQCPDKFKRDRLTLGGIWTVNDMEVFEIMFKKENTKR